MAGPVQAKAQADVHAECWEEAVWGMARQHDGPELKETLAELPTHESERAVDPCRCAKQEGVGVEVGERDGLPPTGMGTRITRLCPPYVDLHSCVCVR